MAHTQPAAAHSCNPARNSTDYSNSVRVALNECLAIDDFSTLDELFLGDNDEEAETRFSTIFELLELKFTDESPSAEFVKKILSRPRMTPEIFATLCRYLNIWDIDFFAKFVEAASKIPHLRAPETAFLMSEYEFTEFCLEMQKEWILTLTEESHFSLTEIRASVSKLDAASTDSQEIQKLFEKQDRVMRTSEQFYTRNIMGRKIRIMFEFASDSEKARMLEQLSRHQIAASAAVGDADYVRAHFERLVDAAVSAEDESARAILCATISNTLLFNHADLADFFLSIPALGRYLKVFDMTNEPRSSTDDTKILLAKSALMHATSKSERRDVCIRILECAVLTGSRAIAKYITGQYTFNVLDRKRFAAMTLERRDFNLFRTLFNSSVISKLTCVEFALKAIRVRDFSLAKFLLTGNFFPARYRDEIIEFVDYCIEDVAHFPLDDYAFLNEDTPWYRSELDILRGGGEAKNEHDRKAVEELRKIGALFFFGRKMH
jgi:hypothetical protein